MLKIHSGCDEHDKYKKLGALAAAGGLVPLESAELHAHLRLCEQCHEVFRQYQALTTQGMAILADEYGERRGQASWYDAPAFDQLLERIQTTQQTSPEKNRPTPNTIPPSILLRTPARSIATMLLAACLIFAVAFGSYRVGIRTHSQSVSTVTPLPTPVNDRFEKIAEEKKHADEVLAEQAKRLAQLQADGAQKEQELGKLRSALRAIEDRSNKLQASSSHSDAQLLALSQERDSLTTQLQSLNQSYGIDVHDECVGFAIENRDNGLVMRWKKVRGCSHADPQDGWPMEGCGGKQRADQLCKAAGNRDHVAVVVPFRSAQARSGA